MLSVRRLNFAGGVIDDDRGFEPGYFRIDPVQVADRLAPCAILGIERFRRFACFPCIDAATDTALLVAERGARKPRFRSWREATAEGLLGRLLPNGKAKGTGPGARVADTALTLLALQTAYRAY